VKTVMNRLVITSFSERNVLHGIGWLVGAVHIRFDGSRCMSAALLQFGSD
jgi:hypothetical protein